MKLLLIDGNSVLNRAYFALPEWRNRSGEATAGVYGFLSMLLRAIDDIKPSHLIVVFDSRGGGNFRQEILVSYQANRNRDQKIEDDIWSQVEKLKVIFQKMDVPVFTAPGFEADDVIGSLCKKLAPHPKSLSLEKEREILEIVIITGDRDLMQLVNENVNLYMPGKGVSDGQIVDRNSVKERLGVWPEQVIDYKALVGDSSDNYPGVQGVGPKTAITLLDKYQTFEKIIEEADNPKVKAGVEGGKVSKKLATIKIDVPVDVNIDLAKLPSEEKMVTVFKELGHKSLIRRVTGEEVKTQDESQQKLF